VIVADAPVVMGAVWICPATTNPVLVPPSHRSVTVPIVAPVWVIAGDDEVTLSFRHVPLIRNPLVWVVNDAAEVSVYAVVAVLKAPPTVEIVGVFHVYDDVVRVMAMAPTQLELFATDVSVTAGIVQTPS
jgi:hypothetical protein